MKTVIMFIPLAAICTFLHPADDVSYVTIEQQENIQLFHYHDKGQRTSFYQDILQKSRLIKKIDHKTPEIYASLVQQLCKDRSSLQLLLLHEALKRDAIDQHKKKEPSADTIDFANNDVRPKDLCWLTNTANFWDIRYTYKALIQRIAYLLEGGRINIDTQSLNSDSILEVLDQVNLFGLKTTITKKLQEEITHNISPALSDLDLHSFSFEQLNLLFKASNQWKKQETYALKKADATCYISLPPALQTDKLFTLAPRIIPS